VIARTTAPGADTGRTADGGRRTADGSAFNPPTVVQCTVVRGKLPALVVIHDEEGDWLVGDGINDPNLDGACDLICLTHIVALDATLASAATLPKGNVIRRSAADEPWTVGMWQYED
jgi:hypothetical protein